MNKRLDKIIQQLFKKIKFCKDTISVIRLLRNIKLPFYIENFSYKISKIDKIDLSFAIDDFFETIRFTDAKKDLRYYSRLKIEKINTKKIKKNTKSIHTFVWHEYNITLIKIEKPHEHTSN